MSGDNNRSGIPTGDQKPSYADLIERLEKATGPDRELDALIWLAVTPGATRKSTTVKSSRGLWPDYIIDETRDASGSLVTAPSYTGSLDDTLTLLIEGYRWAAGVSDGYAKFYAIVRHPNEGNNPSLKWMASGFINAPITLCIPALKARAASETSDHQRGTRAGVVP